MNILAVDGVPVPGARQQEKPVSTSKKVQILRAAEEDADKKYRIKVFQNPCLYLTREYDLSNCSVIELEKLLIAQCKAASINFKYAAVMLPDNEYTRLKETDRYLVKGICNEEMTMREVAVKILKNYGAG